MSKSVYQIITDQILKKLDEGVIAWRQPFKDGPTAMNWQREYIYRGINLMLTEPGGEYATARQIREAGGNIKPDEFKNPTLIVYYVYPDEPNKTSRKSTKKSEENNEENTPIKRPYPLYHRVYEINTQCEGLQSKRKLIIPTDSVPFDPIQKAEQLIAGYKNKPQIVENLGGRAFYNITKDVVSMPPASDFHEREGYYATLFHELLHSTGHSSRLDRPIQNKFKSKAYAKEELIVEIGAAMLCGIVGIENKIIDNAAAYIENWRQVLSDDPKLIISASNLAQKAADYIQSQENVISA